MSSEAPAPGSRTGFSPNDELGLLDVLVFIYRNWLWVFTSAVIVGVVTYAWYESGTSPFEATSTCLIIENNPKQAVSLALCQRMVESGKIAQKVTEKLREKKLIDANRSLLAGFARAKIQDGRALTISASAETAILAAAMANEAAAALTEATQSLKTEMIEGVTTAYTKEIPAIQQQLQAAENRRNEVAGKFSKSMQEVYQKWRLESMKADEGAIATAMALQKETMELLQAYQTDTFTKVRALEESLKIDFLRTQAALLNGRGTTQHSPQREGLNAAILANQDSVLRTREASAVSAGPSTWPKPKTPQSKTGNTQIVDSTAKSVVKISADELQKGTGEFLASLAAETNNVKPEIAFEPAPAETLSRADLAKAVFELAQAEAGVRKLQAEREIGFLKMRQERAGKLERLKSETEARQRDLLFVRDQELDGLRFAQESADEQTLAELTARRLLYSDMTKANNTAVLSKAENGANEVQIIDQAIPPSAPQGRASMKYAMIAAGLGAFLGFCIAATLEIAKVAKKSALS